MGRWNCCRQWILWSRCQPQGWERATVKSKLAAAIVGSDATVKAGMQKLLHETGADELIVVTDTLQPEARLQ